MSDENQLIQEARRGNLTAFEELISSYERRIYNYCLRMTNNREDAEGPYPEVL